MTQKIKADEFLKKARVRLGNQLEAVGASLDKEEAEIGEEPENSGQSGCDIM